MKSNAINVLVIDDEEAMCDYVRFALEMEGFVVQCACNGAEGMDIVKRTAPRVVVTDMIMPDAEGIETIREIKALHPTCKIIAMSGAANSETYLSMAHCLGAVVVLQKPFDRAQIQAAVRQALEENAES